MSSEVSISIKKEGEEEGMGIQIPEETTTPAKYDHKLNKKDEDLLRELKEQEEKPSSHTEQDAKTVRTKIQKFPKIANRPDESLIIPSEISIGPIHANNPDLTNRKLKLRLANKFVAESKNTAEVLLGLVRDDIDAIKKCFKECVVMPYEDDALARILFIDACSVLQFIRSSDCGDLTEFEINNNLVFSIQKDMFLLENQLPFRLLKVLINSSDIKPKLVRSIYRFVSANVMSPFKYYLERYYENCHTGGIISRKTEDPVHLLDLLRSELLFPFEDEDHETPARTSRPPRPPPIGAQKMRNVQDLKCAGIRFRPGNSSTFLAVSFSTRWLFGGELNLPAMVVDNTTSSKLWNLVAYEMCPDNYTCDFGVSSFLSFMDSLVDNEQDVRDLIAHRVLWNRLSTDEEVATLFNTIGSNLVVTDGAYRDVKRKIQKHYESERANWAAQLCQDHFSSPWKILALFAAAVALLLTAFSTWFTVYPLKDK